MALLCGLVGMHIWIMVGFFNRNSTELWMGSSIGSLCDVDGTSIIFIMDVYGACFWDLNVMPICF